MLKIKHLRHIAQPLTAFNILFKLKYGVPFKKWLVNIIFQRIFRINSEVDFQVNYTSTVIVGSGIEVGKNVSLSFALSGNCYIQGGNGIRIDDDTIFAPGVKIISANHDHRNNMQWAPGSPIIIGKRCWIGANAVILPEVQLGDECVVGAGAVVTSSFPSRSVLIGVPARAIKVN